MRRKNYMKETLRRFERMLKTDIKEFFDLDTYEQVAEHYLDQGDWEKAIKACDLGLENYPYSLELILSKAQLLANRNQFEHALELLEKAALVSSG